MLWCCFFFAIFELKIVFIVVVCFKMISVFILSSLFLLISCSSDGDYHQLSSDSDSSISSQKFPEAYHSKEVLPGYTFKIALDKKQTFSAYLQNGGLTELTLGDGLWLMKPEVFLHKRADILQNYPFLEGKKFQAIGKYKPDERKMGLYYVLEEILDVLEISYQKFPEGELLDFPSEELLPEYTFNETLNKGQFFSAYLQNGGLTELMLGDGLWLMKPEVFLHKRAEILQNYPFLEGKKFQAIGKYKPDERKMGLYYVLEETLDVLKISYQKFPEGELRDFPSEELLTEYTFNETLNKGQFFFAHPEEKRVKMLTLGDGLWLMKPEVFLRKRAEILQSHSFLKEKEFQVILKYKPDERKMGVYYVLEETLDFLKISYQKFLATLEEKTTELTEHLSRNVEDESIRTRVVNLMTTTYVDSFEALPFEDIEGFVFSINDKIIEKGEEINAEAVKGLITDYLDIPD